jgi:ubiquinone/menaquinone biosynthesis C-methylase UbiE
MPSSLHSDQYKKGQRQGWDSVAEGWEKWWKTFEHDAQKVNERLIELAKIEEGNRVLDIATGIGEPAITAAKKVGAKGYVLAIDISPKMLSIAKQRAESLGLQNIVEFKEIDAEKITLDSQGKQQPSSSLPFDVVLCRWGLMFFPNLTYTLSKIYQLLLPGGRVAAAVWSEPAKVPKLSTAIDIVIQQVGISSSSGHYAEILRPFSLVNVNIVKDALIEAGFKDIYIETLNITFDFNSADDYADFANAIIAPIHNTLASETDERKERIWRAVKEEVTRKYSDKALEKGYIKMNNETICILARKG